MKTYFQALILLEQATWIAVEKYFALLWKLFLRLLRLLPVPSVPEVSRILRVVITTVTSNARTEILKAHRLAYTLGFKAAVAELLISPQPRPQYTQTAYVTRVLADLDRNALNLLDEFSRQIGQEGLDEASLRRLLESLSDDISLRTALGSQVATHRGFYEGQRSAAMFSGQVNLRKTWVAQFVDNTPCPHCTQLHGTTVGIDEEFPTLRETYVDLQAPPLHPRCKCSIVFSADVTPVRSPVEQEGSSTFTAADIRRMSASRFTLYVMRLNRWLNRMRRVR